MSDIFEVLTDIVTVALLIAAGVALAFGVALLAWGLAV